MPKSSSNKHQIDSAVVNDGENMRVFIVEDEPAVAAVLARVIQSCGEHRVAICADRARLLDEMSAFGPDLLFTDLMMPDLDGFAVIRMVKETYPDLPVVVVTAYSTLDNAVHAVKLGAFDLLPKPFNRDTVELTLEKVRRDGALRAQTQALSRLVRDRDPSLSALIGDSRSMRELRELLYRLRETANANVLVEGESGTGKELVARAVHGGRGHFVALNMAAIPDELAEAELFGYQQGAFTGATAQRRGLIAEAHGGTLFLDEINAASPRLQAKLLRVLEERSLRPLGSNEETALDFRLVAATNQDLRRLAEAGEFRQDLYFRLRVLNVRLPPLRERREDIPLLAAHFLERYARSHGRRVRRIDEPALVALMQADWSGNVRVLENVIERAVILCPPNESLLPAEHVLSGLADDGGAQPVPARGAREFSTLAEMERRYIREVLDATGGNRTEAARILRIDYKTLMRKL
jgi:DNA-binding NtrC family response regulator